jgi:hypothetical protein
MLSPQSVPPIVYTALGWAGGAASTVGGSWLANKIRVYHDARRSHHDDLRANVVAPLRDVINERLPLFNHREPVILETWSRLSIAKAVPAEEDAGRHAAILEAVNPWQATFDAVDRALFEDAKTKHHKELISEVQALADAWAAHALRCLTWTSQMAGTILSASGMNPYEPPYTAPYVLHLRLGGFVYRRLFGLPTEVLRKQSQGQFWSLEGAPTVPDVTGAASIAYEGQIDRLIKVVNDCMAANRERATQLQNEARGIYARSVELRAKLELAIASKKLRKRCSIVPFF